MFQKLLRFLHITIVREPLIYHVGHYGHVHTGTRANCQGCYDEGM